MCLDTPTATPLSNSRCPTRSCGSTASCCLQSTAPDSLHRFVSAASIVAADRPNAHRSPMNGRSPIHQMLGAVIVHPKLRRGARLPPLIEQGPFERGDSVSGRACEINYLTLALVIAHPTNASFPAQISSASRSVRA